MLDNGEMLAEKSRQLSLVQRNQLRDSRRGYLDAEARANAGDPGPVVLRRLSNVEYDNTVRDLTGVEFRPAREFPVDGAAGEGFTNVGEAPATSPSMLDKYVRPQKRSPRTLCSCRMDFASPRNQPVVIGLMRSSRISADCTVAIPTPKAAVASNFKVSISRPSRAAASRSSDT